MNFTICFMPRYKTNVKKMALVFCSLSCPVLSFPLLFSHFRPFLISKLGHMSI